MTQEQKQILKEFDQQRELLEQQLNALTERRLEFINKIKAGVK